MRPARAPAGTGGRGAAGRQGGWRTGPGADGGGGGEGGRRPGGGREGAGAATPSDWPARHGDAAAPPRPAPGSPRRLRAWATRGGRTRAPPRRGLESALACRPAPDPRSPIPPPSGPGGCGNPPVLLPGSLRPDRATSFQILLQ